jgi:hypothetical protein
MPVTATPVFPQTPKNGKVQILPADTTTLKTLYTAGSNGSKIHGIIATSTDTAAQTITLSITNAGTSYTLGTIQIAITAGTVVGTPSTNFLDLTKIPGLPLDSDGNPEILLVSGDTLQVNSGTTVTAAKVLNFIAIGADF